MMQAAQSRDRNDSAIGRWILFGLASGGGFFAKAEVGAVFMVQLGYKTPIKPAFE
jgi:hypothetical protein